MAYGGAGVQDGAAQQERTGQVKTPGLSPLEFMRYARDVQYQPSWRTEADKCVDYYDSNQLTQDTLMALQQKGMGPLIKNIIAPIVNVVLGMEAKTRSDWRVTGDDDAVTDVAEAMSSKLFEAERETGANRACSDGYGGQIKAGLGWVEVSRNANPFQYPYRANFMHRREMFWDWRDLTYDLNKARYQIRKRWYDIDQAQAYFPQHKELFTALRGDSMRTYLHTPHRGTDLSYSLESLRGLDMEDFEEWRSLERDRVCLYETWYRRWVNGYVLRLQTGDVLELDMKNQLHIALLSRGLAKPEQAVYSKMRMSLWTGPFCLMDVACKNDYSPYVPFWGYREDRTGVPYGLIRAMLSPQDEVNVRRQKMMWLLGAKRITMDTDALDTNSNTIDTVMQEVGRPDAVVVLNPSRKNKDAFKVDTDLGLADKQFEIMRDAEEAAQKVTGVFNAMLGRESNADSGIAINSLVEQGTTALAEINDNYRFARRLVGTRLLDLVRDDLLGQQVTVMVGDTGKRKPITLNKPAQHPQSGAQIIVNDLRSAKVKVGLEDVPSTPAYRQQQLTMLTEVMKGLPPQLQAAIAPFYMEATDLQKRREMADAVRKAMGIIEPRTPEEEQQMQQEQQEQKAIQREMVLSELRERNAKADMLTAQAAKFRADATAEGGLDDGEHAALEQEFQRIQAEMTRKLDDLTAQRLAERSQAQLREQALKNKIASDSHAKAQEGSQVDDLKKQIDALTQQFTDQMATAKQNAKAKAKKK